MNEITSNLVIRYSDGKSMNCELTRPRTQPWYLMLKRPDDGSLRFDGEDLFDCLVALRRHFESLDGMVLCNGARTDVFPSGMSRQMSAGVVAYITRLGKPSGKEDTVNIFDSADITTVGTIEEQREHHRLWAESLRPK